MHEMSIAMRIVDIATESVDAHGAVGRVDTVNLKIGKLSAIVPDSLLFCFDAIARGTVLEGASLHIEEIPIRALCNTCRTEWTLETPAFTCPACQSGDIRILSGNELDIDSIELSEGES